MGKDYGMLVQEVRWMLAETQEEFGKNFDPPASASLVSRWERGVNQPNMKRKKRIEELCWVV